MIRIPLYIIFVFMCSGISGQYFSSGTEPFNVRWRYIETERLKVIFPDSMINEASRFANIVESNYALLNSSMNPNPSKMDVVFHNRNIISNGFVTWAPKRMEIVTTPSRDFHSQDWLESLALHEYRHVLQADKLNTGITKILTLLVGQTGIGIPVMQIPLWVNEGDAVITESISGFGRGTLPTFEMPFRAFMLDSGKIASYDKLYFGSYRHFVPDYYKLGYYMTGYSKLRHGNDIWNNIFGQTGKNPLRPRSINSVLNKDYNTNLKVLYHETMDTLREIWNEHEKALNISEYHEIKIPLTRYFTNYRFPHITGDGSVIALKSSIDDVSKIVRVDTSGKETVLHIPGVLYEERLSCSKNLIVWDEVIYDMRWEQKNYSVIKTLNIKNNKVNTLTNKSRFFSPAISPDEKRIAVIETDILNNCSIVLIDADNGSELFNSTAPEKGLLSFPIWYNNHSIIVIFTTVSRGKMIYNVDLETQIWEPLTQPHYDNISQLAVWDNHLIYSAAYSGIDNIHALNMQEKKQFQITSSRFGAFDPFVSPEGNTLIYSEYSSNGYKPVKIKLLPESWISSPNNKYPGVNFMEPLVNKEFGKFQIITVKDTVYTSKPYSRLKNLINFHSWAPFYIDPNLQGISDIEIKPGIILLSQNKLNTAISSFGLSFENNYFKFKPTFSYRGFYPIIDFSATIGGTNKKHILPEHIVPADSIYIYKSFDVRSYIPFRFYNNKYFEFLMPEIGINYENTLFYGGALMKGIFTFHYKLTYYRFLKLSRMDIFPRWGQLLFLTFSHSPFTRNEYGKFISSSFTFYNPGILKHHSIRINCSAQYQKSGKYYFPFNRVSLPRGYRSVINAYYAEFMSRLYIDYNFPVIYPDLSFYSIVYLKRLRANVFNDFGYGHNVTELHLNNWKPKSGSYSSHGIEITADIHLFRFYFPFSIGSRISYIPDFKSFHPELMFSVDISVF